MRKCYWKIFVLLWCVPLGHGFLTLEPEGPKDDLLQTAGYPKPGDIPTLNRKVFRGHRVTIREHPYVASIRRQCTHYLIGALLNKMVVVTIAHPLVDVPVKELSVVLGESYSDRGTILLTVVVVVIHQDFERYTLRNDIALLRLYETVTYKSNIKGVFLSSPLATKTLLRSKKAFVVGWGRCDNMGTELCLDRTSRFFPGEKMDPMLRAVTFNVREHNYYCSGYKRHEIRLRKGMVCAGIAREEDQVAPCLAAPGALLIVEARLIGLQSWGFGCGYSYDLPLIYSDVRHFLGWIQYNNRIMFNLQHSNLGILFRATKAAVLAHWLMETRNVTPQINIRSDRNLEPLPIDMELIQLKGNVYDIRDDLAGSMFKEEKDYMYASLRSELAKAHSTTTVRVKKTKTTDPPKPFLGPEAKKAAQ